MFRLPGIIPLLFEFPDPGSDAAVFNIDLHVHTSRFSECAETLEPEKVEVYAVQASLNVVVITEHDTLWDRDSFQSLQDSFTNIVLFNGVEVTVDSGHHFVVIGIDARAPVYKGMPAMDLIKVTHENCGAVILAHPFRYGLPALKIIQQVDAIEICSTSIGRLESRLADNLARELGIPAVASSDAHSLAKIGWAHTAFPQEPRDERHLGEMIKGGFGKPVLPGRYR